MTQATAPLISYNGTAKTLHWLTAFVILALLLLGMTMGEGDWSPEIRKTLYTSHKTLGILILFITLFRLAWNHIYKTPPLPITIMPVWQVRAARAVHMALYFLLLAVPLSGWMMVSMGPYGLQLFGVIPFPAFPFVGGLESADTLRSIIKESHEILATVIASLVVVHIGAAFMHHFVDRDDVMLRITPDCLAGWLKKLRGG